MICRNNLVKDAECENRKRRVADVVERNESFIIQRLHNITSTNTVVTTDTNNLDNAIINWYFLHLQIKITKDVSKNFKLNI